MIDWPSRNLLDAICKSRGETMTSCERRLCNLSTRIIVASRDDCEAACCGYRRESTITQGSVFHDSLVHWATTTRILINQTLSTRAVGLARRPPRSRMNLIPISLADARRRRAIVVVVAAAVFCAAAAVAAECRCAPCSFTPCIIRCRPRLISSWSRDAACDDESKRCWSVASVVRL